MVHIIWTVFLDLNNRERLARGVRLEFAFCEYFWIVILKFLVVLAKVKNWTRINKRFGSIASAKNYLYCSS